MSTNNVKNNNLVQKNRTETFRLVADIPIDLYNRLISNYNRYNEETSIQLSLAQYLRKVLQESLT
jgi:hypothetical protein